MVHFAGSDAKMARSAAGILTGHTLPNMQTFGREIVQNNNELMQISRTACQKAFQTELLWNDGGQRVFTPLLLHTGGGVFSRCVCVDNWISIPTCDCTLKQYGPGKAFTLKNALRVGGCGYAPFSLGENSEHSFPHRNCQA